MRTVRVYYKSMAGELLVFEFRCSWQKADAEAKRLRPRVLLRVGSYSTYRQSKNYGYQSCALRVEIVHPKHPLPRLENARLVILPSQMETHEHAT